MDVNNTKTKELKEKREPNQVVQEKEIITELRLEIRISFQHLEIMM